MKIAILGWGSLLWEEETEKAREFNKYHDGWKCGDDELGPILKLEFSRVSAVTGRRANDSLGRIEDAVLQEIDPPCNIENRHTNDFRERLDELRKALRAG